ncbi:hypothetical protein [Abyssicoccus albus]|uniref:hypothetical protein n=1 Tax=Abyssicoccus albus TaxID=1817405 RepID=UPI00097E2789|nr:hypothetical protein [Abyssicoccus albus]AQL55447.1 hypothetical protein BVH56_00055 [Abyssicoccus albus]
MNKYFVYIIFIILITLLSIIYTLVIGNMLDEKKHIASIQTYISFINIFATFGGAYLGAKISGENASKLLKKELKTSILIDNREENIEFLDRFEKIDKNFIISINKSATNNFSVNKLLQYTSHLKKLHIDYNNLNNVLIDKKISPKIKKSFEVYFEQLNVTYETFDDICKEVYDNIKWNLSNMNYSKQYSNNYIILEKNLYQIVNSKNDQLEYIVVFFEENEGKVTNEIDIDRDISINKLLELIDMELYSNKIDTYLNNLYTAYENLIYKSSTEYLKDIDRVLDSF